ncbi:Cucumisin [Hibiscus syriacus]|uniref:Cucumisin n=1 Tax=Hibiscus syriacus TaxID=106335 RepID=A0A6A3BRK7_HIBSY|nr:Cucumisin [Hibiscus syriacus]
MLKQVYIVYMGNLPKGKVSTSSLHNTMLEEVVPSSVGSDVLLYSYHRSFNGFAAKLTKDEANKLREKDGVVSVFLSQKKQLHTTRSWDFMGLNKKVLRSFIESDIIVGMLDTGIWPESQSFNDTGLGPIPNKWKGTCQSSANFTCNKKIIGAKYYRADGDSNPNYDFRSPRDSEGHGTHTSSTAAGGFVNKASLYGLAKGTARGGVPSARIAVYKICWSDGCSDVDILAAFDDAIADGVDIISLSVGSIFSSDYFDDPIAIGAFHSMKNGILTSNSAGNSGPRLATITNFSPWSLSVAASTIDRKFITRVKLGNGEIYEGTSINTFDLDGKMYPFIAGAAATNTSQGYTSEDSRYCDPETLNKTLVEGKIVFCDYDSNGEGPVEAGAVGAVFQSGDFKDLVFAYGLPLSNLNLDDGRHVLNYVNTTENPTATIFKTEVKDNQFAPFVVSFSSRGPNPVTADILKPDLTAPGVDILAAWSEAASLTDTEDDTRIVPYNIISGTSMSCPHATGAAAYVKSFHPTWSPAAIKSALMTTAFPMSSENNLEAEFAYGAGHINPARAARPGLIYDAGETDFVNFLCGQGYNSKQLALITGTIAICSEETNGTVWDLNYPSFALSTTPGNSVTRVFYRTVTNVGSAVSTYKAVVKSPPGLVIQVQPSLLSFKSLGQKQSFTVTARAEVGNSMISGALIWDDGVHQVRNPIVAYASLVE